MDFSTNDIPTDMVDEIYKRLSSPESALFSYTCRSFNSRHSLLSPSSLDPDEDLNNITPALVEKILINNYFTIIEWLAIEMRFSFEAIFCRSHPRSSRWSSRLSLAASLSSERIRVFLYEHGFNTTVENEALALASMEGELPALRVLVARLGFDSALKKVGFVAALGLKRAGGLDQNQTDPNHIVAPALIQTTTDGPPSNSTPTTARPSTPPPHPSNSLNSLSLTSHEQPETASLPFPSSQLTRNITISAEQLDAIMTFSTATRTVFLKGVPFLVMKDTPMNRTSCIQKWFRPDLVVLAMLGDLEEIKTRLTKLGTFVMCQGATYRAIELS